MLWPHFAHKWAWLSLFHHGGKAGDAESHSCAQGHREGGLGTPRHPAPALPAEALALRNPHTPLGLLQPHQLRPRPQAINRTYSLDCELPNSASFLNSPCRASPGKSRQVT